MKPGEGNLPGVTPADESPWVVGGRLQGRFGEVEEANTWRTAQVASTHPTYDMDLQFKWYKLFLCLHRSLVSSSFSSIKTRADKECRRLFGKKSKIRTGTDGRNCNSNRVLRSKEVSSG
ncbi:unnamed protein product [Eretmochelys imbricata]